MVLVLLPGVPHAHASPPSLSPRVEYLLSCGGCHGLQGVSNSRLVPDLSDQVGFFLRLPEGRRYLARLPNVAFSMTTDRQLAAILNYVVFTLGGSSAPRDARRYTASEVSRLRRQPLTEVSLVRLRRRLVKTLIGRCHAPPELLRYSEEGYGDRPGG